MEFDTIFLSRLQFAITILFHYLFPPLSIGLGAIMVILEYNYVVLKKKNFERICKFWVKVFAANFSVGVATGIVMEFQFGTNWSTYSRFVGDIFGSPLAAEGIFAFFLESGFLAILLFGWDRVKPSTHFFATLMVSLGSIFSAIWIIIANSWQQTPTGYQIVGEGIYRKALITDFWAVVFNPSSMISILHAVTGAFIVGGFFVMSISAYYLLKKRHNEFARISFKTALIFTFIFSIAQLVEGHKHAKIVGEYQPAKLAAFEGHYITSGNVPVYLFGWVDTKKESVTGLPIPGLLSFLMTSDFNGEITGLDKFKQEDRPNVQLTFQTYHIMIALGMYFILITTIGLIALRKDKIFNSRLLLKIFMFSVPLPYIANLAGWSAKELGRQPWIVYGLLRTSDGVSPSIKTGEVWTSLVLFVLIYILLFLVWLYVMNKKIQGGPEEKNESDDELVFRPGGESLLKDKNPDKFKL